jgi:hypothetical protein
MKGINSTGAPLVHVPGWMGGCKSLFKDCLQQSKSKKYLECVLNLVLKFCKNLGFSLSGHCE